MGAENITVEETDSVSDLCRKFGSLIGTDNPVETRVMMRALEEPGYGINLVTSKNTEGSLNELLNDKENEKYENGSKQINSMSNIELLKKAAASFLVWGKIGFLVVSNEVLEKRENCCLRCPNLTEPYTTLQKLMPSKKQALSVGERLGNRVCGVCGCNLKNKMRMSSESCPQEDPGNLNFTRWGDPMTVDLRS